MRICTALITSSAKFEVFDAHIWMVHRWRADFLLSPDHCYFSLKRVELSFIKGSCLISLRHRCTLHLRAAEATCTYPCTSMYATYIQVRNQKGPVQHPSHISPNIQAAFREFAWASEVWFYPRKVGHGQKRWLFSQAWYRSFQGRVGNNCRAHKSGGSEASGKSLRNSLKLQQAL